MTFNWWRKPKPKVSPEQAARAAEARIREKYKTFQELLTLNTECLELIAGLQEDLQYIPPRRDVVGGRVAAIFDRGEGIIRALSQLSGDENRQLSTVLDRQQVEVGRYISALQELVEPRFATSLSEVGLAESEEVGGKAAYLGEVKSKLGLPVPEGFVLTTEAYRQFCGIRHWQEIRDAVRSVDPDDLETLRAASQRLQDIVMGSELPRGVEVALKARTDRMGFAGLAVRSSAVGEGGERSYAGQFLSMIGVAPEDVVDAYKQVIASRFSERALSYRLSTGLFEVESLMAVLVLPVIRATASGIMYTRDPSNSRSKELWVTSTGGLGLDIASGHTPADLFVVSRKGKHELLNSRLASKTDQIVTTAGSGLEHRQVAESDAEAASLTEKQLAKLASYGVAIEKYFGSPQDVEWAVDEAGEIWVLQSRPLALVQDANVKSKGKVPDTWLASGGVTVFPGRVSGPAFVVEDIQSLRKTPENSIVLLRIVTPEIVQVFPRIAGLAAEWGNVAGHAAALLREFKIPSVFLMEDLFEKVQDGSPVSLDSARHRLYEGKLWEGRDLSRERADFNQKTARDPISQNILSLNLLDPSAQSFRPSACKSTHDVLRYCHEKSVEAMFEASDFEMETTGYSTREVKTEIPLNLYALDLGGGLPAPAPDMQDLTPEQIISKPFQSLWRGVNHPGVSWRRDMPASFSDIASVVASSFAPANQGIRDLGLKSYLLVADEYMNLNSRLAYHFSLVDACLCDDAMRNHVSFRFAGGGATRYRRNLRACFLEACLGHYGFEAHRRGDLVNAWLRKAPAAETDHALDILGRLIACTSQLDMYMANQDTMNWFVEQFVAENYAFTTDEDEPAT